jgi:hypothetical protein
MKKILILTVSLCFIIYNIFSQQKNKIITPEEFFGFRPGEEGMLFKYQPLINYLNKLDKVSPRVKMIEIGESPMGNKMYIVFLSSEENIKNLDKLKTINRELALNPDIDREEKEKYIREGKVFTLVTLSMHSNEVGPAQSAPLIAHQLAVTDDPEILGYLEQVVLMIVPCHNPDGMDMVVDHYLKYKGTRYEGTLLPGVYHKYVGHDNNRDFVSLTQEDTKVIANIYNKAWYPQVLLEKHQMHIDGTRYYVPPVNDPISENINEQIWNWTWIFGSAMAKDMTEKGLAGVSQHYLFDEYWPGSTETALWKNIIGLLTECASVKYATSVYIEPNELKVLSKGLAEHKKSINMPLPWEGGWWKLSDIVEYELASFYSLIKTAAIHKKEILRLRNDICQIEVKKGKTEPPYYYVLPSEQHDRGEMVKLINLLDEHGINIYKISDSFTLNNTLLNENDFIVPLAQPFRAFLIEVMEKQTFPVRHYTPGGEIMKPYDITSWSLPLHMGVKVIKINTYSEELNKSLIKPEFPLKNNISFPDNYSAVIFPSQFNDSYLAIFKLLNQQIKVERIAEDIDIEGNNIRAGSFIIYSDKINRQKLEKIINETYIYPVFITSSITTESDKISIPRIALVESYFHDMDAGWTRYLFDSYSINFKVLRPADIAGRDLTKEFDMIVFPDMDNNVLTEGKYKSADDSYIVSVYPPEYAKGMGKEGMEKVLDFINKGGCVISWGRSAKLFMGSQAITKQNDEKEEFQLPVNDISEGLKKQKFYCPGSLLKIELIDNHPLTWGMQKSAGVFSRGTPVLTTSIPWFDMDRRVIGTLPEKNILLSGYIENEDLISNKSMMVWIKKGKGQLVLYGFYPQFRASTAGTYKLLFNALLLHDVDYKP